MDALLAARLPAGITGSHLTADLRGCAADAKPMHDAAALRERCLAAVRAAGLTPVAEVFHAFEPAADAASATGLTGVVLLAESHVAVHTWPEHGAVTLDVFVCNRGRDNSIRAEALVEALIALFAPAQVERQAIRRRA